MVVARPFVSRFHKRYPNQFFVGEVEQRTGATARSLQHWIDARVIRPTPETVNAGKGVHRMLPPEELVIAALLVPLAGAGIPIGKLARFAEEFRPALWKHARFATVGQVHTVLGRVLERAVRGDGINWLAIADDRNRFYFALVTDENGREPVITPDTFFPKNVGKVKAPIHLLNLTNLLAGVLEP
jgi:hypothetical protein